MYWEYKVVHILKDTTLVELQVFLNEQGRDRWELVSINSGGFMMCVFKRELLEEIR